MKKTLVPAKLYSSFIFLLIAFLLTACSGTGSPQKNNTGEKKVPQPSPELYKKPPTGFNDTLVINGLSAVFFNPDSLQQEKIKAIRKKEDYETEEHYCLYQMRNALVLLKKSWPQIHIVETSRTRYLLFIKSGKNKTCIDLNNKSDMCGIFLFDSVQDPELCDMMNFDTALRFYFKK